MEITGIYKIINNWLKQQGRQPNGDPLWRLSWSGDQRELRQGIFNDFTDSGLFLRQFVGTREMPKYPFIHEKWILEKWAPPELVMMPELPESRKGSYEPIWVFETVSGQFLAPTVKVVQFIVEYHRKNIVAGKHSDMKSQQEMEDAEILNFMVESGVAPKEALDIISAEKEVASGRILQP